MGKRGPAPEPTALKLLKGETRPSELNPSQPVPPTDAGVPDPPRGLGRIARATWRRLAPTMHPVRLLTEWDLDTFSAYCAAVEFERRAYRDLRDAELVGRQLATSKAKKAGDTTTVTEREIVAPAFRTWKDAVGVMRALAQEFGLTPSARATIRLETSAKPEDAKAAGLLS